MEFTPENAQEVNFNLICKVKKKTAPLLVNIKAEGFRVASKLVCEDSQGGKVDLASTGVNLINLGEVKLLISYSAVRNRRGVVINGGVGKKSELK